MSSAVDLANLYHGPLEDFVARRTALVRELRATDRPAAEAAGKLRKPPVGVWAIDQLAVDSPALIIELLAAGADARDAQQSVAAGTATREQLILATGRLRDAVEAAARAAVNVLERTEHGISDETGRRIRTTLQAAATRGSAERQTLWTGTLDRDLDVAGFGAVDEPGDDPAELAALLAPLRRETSPASSRPGPDRPDRLEVVARREAERDAADQDAAAERSRALADAKRREADHKAEEARFAAEEASAAELTADAAEAAARAAHLALDS
jgi:hypothetical protein